MQDNKKQELLMELGDLAAQISVGAVGIIAKGFAVCVLWNWFVLGALTDFSLGIAHAIGLGVLINFNQKGGQEWMETEYRRKKGVYEVNHLKKLSFAIFYPSVIIAFAWIVKLFM